MSKGLPCLCCYEYSHNEDSLCPLYNRIKKIFPDDVVIYKDSNGNNILGRASDPEYIKLYIKSKKIKKKD